METIQEYLQNSTQEEKEIRERLDFSSDTFEPDELVISHWDDLKTLKLNKNQIKETLAIIGCPKLKWVICAENSLTKLDLGGCSTCNLTEINLSKNNLTEIIWPQNGLNKIAFLNLSNNQLVDLSFVSLLSKNLWELRINSNKFPPSDLEVFKHLTGLQVLCLNDNLFEGSLEVLKDIWELRHLDVSDTNIDDGLEYLTDKKWLSEFYCYPVVKDEAKNRANQLVFKLGLPEDSYATKQKGEKINFKERLVPYGNARWRERYETELQLERETNQESAEVMDSYYRRQFPYDSNIEHVKSEMNKQILELNLENKQLKEENQKLQEQLEEIAEQIAQIEISPK